MARRPHRFQTIMLVAIVAVGFAVTTGGSTVSAETSPQTNALTYSGPNGHSEDFGRVTVLSNGNYVVTDPGWDSPTANNVGAVHLHDGGGQRIISTLTGSSEGDRVGERGVIEVGSSDFVVLSPSWDIASADDVGAVTRVDGDVGLSDVVSPTNSLHGTQVADLVGLYGAVVLGDGDYIVISAIWDNGGAANAGAVTWNDGESPTVGDVDASNSLVGANAGDRVGLRDVHPGVTALSDDDYVVVSSSAALGRGAVTWGDGASGTVGTVSEENSLVGSQSGDHVGRSGVTPLSNGNYVVASQEWANGAEVAAGAATWADGSGATVGAVGPGNSLVGTRQYDLVGREVIELSNSNYVVASPAWRSGTAAGAGAVTWGDGTIGVSGPISAANSLIGGQTADLVGTSVVALSNGNYVVVSPGWDRGGADGAGAVTWGDGRGGTTGGLSQLNSLVGSRGTDGVGSGGVVALANGNYVVSSPSWSEDDSRFKYNVGAVTWGNGATGLNGEVEVANSLVGGRNDLEVGSGGVFASTSGDYLVVSPEWFAAVLSQRGAVTWGNGDVGITGVVGFANSLVGASSFDRIGSSGVESLTTGDFVVSSPDWDGGSVEDVGAATWVSGSSPTTGMVGPANSIVGSQVDDSVGFGGAVALADGNYAVQSPEWDRGSTADAGAVTWAAGDRRTSLVVDASNSLVGRGANDQVGSRYGPGVADGVQPRPDGDYLVVSDSADSDTQANVGSVTLGVAGVGVSGLPERTNSAFGVGSGELSRPSDQLTSNDSILTATEAGPILFLLLDRSPYSVGVSAEVSAVALQGDATASVSFVLPRFDDVRDGPLVPMCAPASGSAFSMGPTTVTCVATDSAGLTASVSFSVIVTPPPPPPTVGPDVVSVEPGRLLDSRVGGATVDDRFELGRRVAAGETIRLDVAGRGGVPASGVGSVVLNVTLINPSGGGFVTVYPCGAVPNASSMNAPTAGGVVANEVIAKVSAAGQVCIYTSVEAHLAADVTGFVPASSPFVSVEPGRLLDSRVGGATVDDRFELGRRVAAGETIRLNVAGRGGVPASGVGSVVLNVTLINPAGGGFVTMFPCGDLPNASSMNAPTGGGVVANEVIAKVSTGGQVCIYTSVETHLAADVTGFVPAGSGVVSLDPGRLLDSRVGGATVDDRFELGRRVAAGETIRLDVLDRGGVPATGVASVVLNVTLINPSGGGYVTIFPCGTPPIASSINAPAAGGIVANEVIAKVSASGKVCLFTSVETHLAADVTGYIAA